MLFRRTAIPIIREEGHQVCVRWKLVRDEITIGCSLVKSRHLVYSDRMWRMSVFLRLCCGGRSTLRQTLGGSYSKQDIPLKQTFATADVRYDQIKSNQIGHTSFLQEIRKDIIEKSKRTTRYQSMQVFDQFGVAVPAFRVAKAWVLEEFENGP